MIIRPSVYADPPAHLVLMAQTMDEAFFLRGLACVMAGEASEETRAAVIAFLTPFPTESIPNPYRIHTESIPNPYQETTDL